MGTSLQCQDIPYVFSKSGNPSWMKTLGCPPRRTEGQIPGAKGEEGSVETWAKDGKAFPFPPPSRAASGCSEQDSRARWLGVQD